MKKIRNIFITISTVVVVLSLVPMPLKVEKSMEGIRYNEENKGSFENIQINIDGWYFCYVIPMFKENYFTGVFKVGDIVCNFTRYARLTFINSLSGAEAGMHYYDEKENTFRWGGQLRKEGLFKEVSIYQNDKNYISAPAKEVSEADAITRKLFSFFYEDVEE